MDLLCESRCSARVLTVELPGDATVGMLVVKQSYTIKNGQLDIAENQYPVFDSETKIRNRVFATDIVYPKKGIDLVVLGDAVSLDGTPVKRIDVGIRLGTIDRTLRVFGNRYWIGGEEESGASKDSSFDSLLDELGEPEGSGGGIPDDSKFPKVPEVVPEEEEDDDDKADKEVEYKISEPVAFTRIPLTWQYAYGGKSGMESQYADNPEGKGFIAPPVKKGGLPAARGVPLPNIESTDQLIDSWKDQPCPAGCGFYPMYWGLRMREGLQLRGLRPPCVLPAMFNQAHPDFVIATFPENQYLEITNTTIPDPKLRVRMNRPSIAARIERAASNVSLPIKWDLVCVNTYERLIYITGRALFRYDPATDFDEVVRVTPLERI